MICLNLPYTNLTTAKETLILGNKNQPNFFMGWSVKICINNDTENKKGCRTVQKEINRQVFKLMRSQCK